VERYRNVWVMPPTIDPEVLKRTLNAHIAEAMGRPLTDEERKANARLAMTWLKRMAVGEVHGYDVEPAEADILRALRVDDLGGLAAEVAGRLPGRAPQRELAVVVLDKGRKPEVRAAAAEELVRHIQGHGLVLGRDQIKGLEELYAASDDPKVRPALAL